MKMWLNQLYNYLFVHNKVFKEIYIWTEYIVSVYLQTLSSVVLYAS